MASRKCTNLGCQQDYDEEANSDSACRYHAGPVIFHDVKKGYSCCNVVVYDWDEFSQIPGCQIGRHTDEKKSSAFWKSNTVANAERSLQKDGPKIKTIEELDRELEEKRKKEAEERKFEEPVIVKNEAGLYICGNFGCNQPYDPANNEEGGCLHHPSGPGFHDVRKFWTCCNRQAWDWDEFSKIEPCTRGVHKPKYKKK
jgi:disease resistance protein